MRRTYRRAGPGLYRRVPPGPVRVRENGRTALLIACAVCPAEFTATPAIMAGRGKRCPGCGTLHTDDGTFDPEPREPRREPTPLLQEEA